jgi:N-acetylglucosaminyldiphosphoundecaprenol N-acetyl-beta-D-mannosaminyltransferase
MMVPKLADPLPLRRAQEPTPAAVDTLITILGVRITDVTRRRAIEILHDLIKNHSDRARTVYIVNAHTLNLATADPQYRQVLNAADYVFSDGTGVRWAARLKGRKLQDNLAGTDLVPELLRSAAGGGFRYFLLGADETTIGRAARFAAGMFPAWHCVGFHHGYLANPALDAAVVQHINAARPHLLLVGMGNPLQEKWLHDHRRALEVPLGLGVGGLFHYWAGTLRRSPGWLRRLGAEWLGILYQQPWKVKRYLLGNPLFLWRAIRDALGSCPRD